MIQIIGGTGMLGSEVVRLARQWGIPFEDTYVDVVYVEKDQIVASVVVNCSGAPSSGDREKLVNVNQVGPRRIAQKCEEVGSRLIHVSTDAIFNRSGPHPESHYCDPSSLYGRTKMLGEVKTVPHLTVRTSFVGLGRRGVVAQLLNTSDPILASTKFLWSGHTATTIAEVLLQLSQRPDITGLLHIPGESQSRYELAVRLATAFGVDVERVVQDDSYVTDRRLVSSRWRALDLPALPSFESQVERLVLSSQQETESLR